MVDRYGYWFGWIKDWGNMAEILDWNRKSRKIHKVRDLLVFPWQQGFAWDPRWDRLQIEPDWHLLRYDSFVGTDGGLHHGWRRVLLDPPWIEVTTLNELLERNWTPIDHGDLGLVPDRPMDWHYPAGGHYNDYFWQFCYGGVSDGHFPLIPAGVKIESYFDYVPYLRYGQRIPSGRKMGDDRTPGTIIYETLRNLRPAPDNALTRLAWRAYFMTIAEQTFHSQTDYRSGESPGEDTGGPYLDPGAKSLANLVRQVNKIVAAAAWADEAAQDGLTDVTQVSTTDLDLDGEDEYVLQNRRVFAIFEDDGGRLEYAFAYNPSVGRVALIAPFYVTALSGRPDYEAGESLPDTPWVQVAFGDAAGELNKRFRFDRFSIRAGRESLTFRSSDGSIDKTFRLDGDTLLAHYATRDVGDLTIGFALPVGLTRYVLPGLVGTDQVGQHRREGGVAICRPGLCCGQSVGHDAQ